MSLPSSFQLYDVIEATWPAARRHETDGWVIRAGADGGQRVSATTQAGGEMADIATAEKHMDALGQPHLFMIRQGDDTLDSALGKRGYRHHDPVTIWAGRTDVLTDQPVPRMSAFNLWPPLAISAEIWQAGGIGPGRRQVMHRVQGPKTAILSRANERAAGTGFVAIHGDIAMIHAIEVVKSHRRCGVGNNIMRAAAHWAQDNGARYISLVVTDVNAAANALYCKSGLTKVGQYHYRRQ